MPALVEYPVAQELSHATVGVPGIGGHPISHDLLALRLDVGHPTGQCIENGVVPAGGAVAGDPEHAVVGVGQGGVEIRRRGVEVDEPLAHVPVAL